MSTKRPHRESISRVVTWIVRIGLSVILGALIYRIYGQINELRAGGLNQEGLTLRQKPAAAAGVHSGAAQAVEEMAVKGDEAALPGAHGTWHDMPVLCLDQPRT